MKPLYLVLAVAALASGCTKRKLHWGDTRATTVTVDGFSVPVPAGWRDASEASDDEMKQLLAKQPGAHLLVREDFDGASIVVKGGPNEPTTSPPCDAIASMIAKQESAASTDVRKLTIDGDPGCQWTYKKGDLTADYWLRFRGDKLLAVMCFAQGSAANMTACEDTRKAAVPAQ